MIDLHNHFVPGVDDGCRSIEESLRHLRILAAEGVRRVGVSPHLYGHLTLDAGRFEARVDELEAGFHALETATAACDDVPQLSFGQELRLPDVRMVRPALDDPRVGVGYGDWVLIEFGFELPADAVGIIRAVQDAGRRPLIAHPERYRRNLAPVDAAEIEEWREAGAWLQINGGSLIGAYGHRVGALGWRLIEEGVASVVATDHHGDGWAVSVAEVRAAVEDRVGVERTDLLMRKNPERVLNGAEC